MNGQPQPTTSSCLFHVPIAVMTSSRHAASDTLGSWLSGRTTAPGTLSHPTAWQPAVTINATNNKPLTSTGNCSRRATRQVGAAAGLRRRRCGRPHFMCAHFERLRLPRAHGTGVTCDDLGTSGRAGTVVSTVFAGHSSMHVAEQPSPSTVLPSSHSSPGSTISLPQIDVAASHGGVAASGGGGGAASGGGGGGGASHPGAAASGIGGGGTAASGIGGGPSPQ